MNSYNENLNSSVIASLQAQELEQATMQAQLNASMFTLYYAEGAKITANEKLDASYVDYYFQQEVKDKAVNNNNIAVNLLASANQEKQYVAQSVTNTATAAANVQVSTNAIVRLASDMGSILSILNAAEYGTAIYDQTKEISMLMNDTAYNAEVTSQWAMEASALTAGVSASTVADMSKSTTASVTNLLTVVSNQFDNTAALVAADNAALANASVAEKKAEGALEDVNVEFFASKTAYQLAVNELNLNLQVSHIAKKGSDYKYTVHFEGYLNPFYNCVDEDKSPEMKKYHTSPVKDYFIMLVKESKKSTFLLSTAEGIIDVNPRQYLQFTHDVKDGKNNIEKDIFISDILDSDGEAMQMGQNYVVFVMARFNEDYKKTLNNFDDFLTAPSAPFSLTNQLSSPKHQDIHVVPNKTGDAQVLEFSLEENKHFKVEYRCMFLPDNSDLVKGLLTERGLRKIEWEVEKLEQIAEQYDPIIVKDQATIISTNTTIDSLNVQLEVNRKHKNRTPALEKEEAALVKQLKEEQAILTKTKADLRKNQTAKNAAMSKVEPAKESKPGFFFNRLLAEQVAAGNYTVSHLWKDHPKEKEKDSDYTMVYQQMNISDNTTDNFGNPLIIGKKYVPVILSVAKVDEENADQFTNSLSAYQATKSFIYKTKK